MKSMRWWLPLAGLALSSAGLSFAQDEKKGTLVELGGMKSRAPAAWSEEPAANQMRLAQFKLAKVSGDSRDAEIVICKGIGGSAKDNIERWKKMFQPVGGKSLDDVAKVTEFKVGDASVTYLEVSGTYLFKERPFDPNAKPQPLANYRMLGVV